MMRRNMAVSPAVQKHISEVSGCRVTYIPSGIHCTNYRSRPLNERSGILYLGRIVKHKNLRLLIDAFEILKQKGYRGELIIAGDGPWSGALETRIAASPVARCISLRGPVLEEAKIELLAMSEVLVVPSKREGFPRVVAEAMASGLPTATPDYPENGTVHIVRYYGCGEVSHPSPQGLAETIRSLLSHWESYSRRGLARAPELDWASLNPQIETLATSLRSEAS
jgi:glycosyltransferase involved in cell wall biosynthesis